jgi:hypothetical protein
LRHVFSFQIRSSSRTDFALDYCEVDKTVGKQPWWVYPSKETLDLLLRNYRTFMNRFGYEFYRENGEPRMAVKYESTQRRFCRPIQYGRHTT